MSGAAVGLLIGLLSTVAGPEAQTDTDVAQLVDLRFETIEARAHHKALALGGPPARHPAPTSSGPLTIGDAQYANQTIARLMQAAHQAEGELERPEAELKQTMDRARTAWRDEASQWALELVESSSRQVLRAVRAWTVLIIAVSLAFIGLLLHWVAHSRSWIRQKVRAVRNKPTGRSRQRFRPDTQVASAPGVSSSSAIGILIAGAMAMAVAGIGCAGRGGPTPESVAEATTLPEATASLKNELAHWEQENQSLGPAPVANKPGRSREELTKLLGSSDGKNEAAQPLLHALGTVEARWFRLYEGACLVDELARDQEELRARTAELAQRNKSWKSAVWVAHLVDETARVGVCLAAGAFVITAPLLLALRRRSRLRAEAQRCPRCLDSSQLTTRPSTVRSSIYHEPEYVSCQTCNYQFPASHRDFPRLCFPTIGVISSGKTHWLATVYSKVTKTQDKATVAVSFDPMPSIGDTTFNEVLDLIEKYRTGTQPSQYNPYDLEKLPYPLVIHVQDHDEPAPSQVMINLFDFAGGHTIHTIDDDLLRRRALMCEGFFLFLDPTQAGHEGPGGGIDEQIRAARNFIDNLRAMRDMPPGRPIEVPVAVCVSKIDLLTLPHVGLGEPAALELVRELLGKKPASRKRPAPEDAEELVPSMTAPAPITLSEVRRRSRLIGRHLPALFPTWGLDDLLRDNFGGHYMYFPLTPVGLIERELGEMDLSKRTIRPFGMLEPIVWMLYMHGYNVFW